VKVPATRFLVAIIAEIPECRNRIRGSYRLGTVLGSFETPASPPCASSSSSSSR
jgi:hypothetical protein